MPRFTQASFYRIYQSGRSHSILIGKSETIRRYGNSPEAGGPRNTLTKYKFQTNKQIRNFSLNKTVSRSEMTENADQAVFVKTDIPLT